MQVLPSQKVFKDGKGIENVASQCIITVLPKSINRTMPLRPITTAIFANLMKLKTTLFAGLAIILLGCFDKGDCTDVSSTSVQLNFFGYADKKAKTILIDSIEVVGTNLILFKNKNIATVTLPLNPAYENTTYAFYYDKVVATLDVNYRIRSFVLSPDCNAIELISIQSCTPTVIQDYKIIQPNLTTSASENIRLYF